VDRDIAAGTTPRAAIMAAFSDRLRDAMLKAIGEQLASPAPRHDANGAIAGRPGYLGSHGHLNR
jgi:hypothetical protein